MPKAQSGKVTTFDSEIHLMISEDVSQKGDMSFELKVMSWIIDGKKHKPQLTKQQMSLGESQGIDALGSRQDIGKTPRGL